MKKKVFFLRYLISLLLVMTLGFSSFCTVWAEEEEEEEETEYIPEYVYDPIQSNELTGWPQGPTEQAAAAVVMDLDTSAVLYSKSAYEKMYPASITKIMTAMIVLEHADLDAKITFSDIVYDLEEDSSNVGIQPGETMTVRDALYALMLESANDAGNGLAEYVGGGYEGFAELMNQKAADLGCVNTHFTNPHGLHNDDHYTCAYDMALIGQAAYDNPQFREIISTTLYHMDPTNKVEEERWFLMHHKMNQDEEGNEWYRDWCIGGKTGYTSDAWCTLVTFGEKDGRRQVCVVMRLVGTEISYADTIELMEYSFGNFYNTTTTNLSSEKTFYQAAGLDYLGWAGKLSKVSNLDKPIAKIINSGLVTLPNGWDVSMLNTTAEKIGENRTRVVYDHEGWKLGSFEMELEPLDLTVDIPYQKELDMSGIIKLTSSQKADKELEQTTITVMEKSREVVRSVRESVSSFYNANKLYVLIVAGVLLTVLLLLIIILFSRVTRGARMRRHKAQQEKELLKREEEIDRKTTEEIEQELRAAMEQDRQERMKEEAELAEMRREEERLRQEEEVIERMNRSRK